MATRFIRGVGYEGTASLSQVYRFRRYKDDRPDLDTFDPTSTTYTTRELDNFASEFIRQGLPEHPNDEYPVVLLNEHLGARYPREIYSSRGVPDPSFGNGMYWRTHPFGRKFNTEGDRAGKGKSFYKG